MRKLHPGYRTIAAIGSVSLFAVLAMTTAANAAEFCWKGAKIEKRLLKD
jgi:hypothetical protein